MTTLFKYINYKYYYSSNPKELPCCFELLEKPEIVFLDDSIKIAGLMCYKANVVFPTVSQNHDIYYTKRIESEIINKNTIYEDIPGILMRFQMEMGSLTLLFEATNIELCSVDLNEFKILLVALISFFRNCPLNNPNS